MDLEQLVKMQLNTLTKPQLRVVLGLCDEARTCDRDTVKCSDILRKIKELDLTLSQRVAAQETVKEAYYAR